MKKIAILSMIFIFLLALSAPIRATEKITPPEVLSSMSEDECISFVISQGVDIPDELKDYDKLGPFIKDCILAVEEDPNHIFVINYYALFKLANDTKDVVNRYYGRTDLENASLFNQSTNSSRSSSLLYSTLHGEWLQTYLEYNCYAYALGYTSSPTGSYYPPDPGYYSAPGEFNISGTVASWADLTFRDLEALGYSCVFTSKDYSEIMEYSDTHTIICLRKATSDSGNDFHYMRLDYNNWYHKPGGSHLLRYNYLPYNGTWTNEACVNGTYFPPAITYTGDIHYFAYAEHNFVIDYTGDDYHSGKQHFYYVRYICTGCGHSYYDWKAVVCLGPPCELQYVSIPSDPVIFTTK